MYKDDKLKRIEKPRRTTRTSNAFKMRQDKLINTILDEHGDQASVVRTPLPTGYHAPTDNVPGDPKTSTDFPLWGASATWQLVPGQTLVMPSTTWPGSVPIRLLETGKHYGTL